MRTFVLHRKEDETGISGTGDIAEGVEFSSGKVALNWITHKEIPSVTIYDRLEQVLIIHGHDGKTVIEWQ